MNKFFALSAVFYVGMLLAGGNENLPPLYVQSRVSGPVLKHLTPQKKSPIDEAIAQQHVGVFSELIAGKDKLEPAILPSLAQQVQERGGMTPELIEMFVLYCVKYLFLQGDDQTEKLRGRLQTFLSKKALLNRAKVAGQGPFEILMNDTRMQVLFDVQKQNERARAREIEQKAQQAAQAVMQSKEALESLKGEIEKIELLSNQNVNNEHMRATHREQMLRTLAEAQEEMVAARERLRQQEMEDLVMQAVQSTPSFPAMSLPTPRQELRPIPFNIEDGTESSSTNALANKDQPELLPIIVRDPVPLESVVQDNQVHSSEVASSSETSSQSGELEEEMGQYAQRINEVAPQDVVDQPVVTSGKKIAILGLVTVTGLLAGYKGWQLLGAMKKKGNQLVDHALRDRVDVNESKLNKSVIV